MSCLHVQFSVALRPQRLIGLLLFGDGEPRTATSTFTQLQSSSACVYIVQTIINTVIFTSPRDRVQELCERRGGRPGVFRPSEPYGFCGRKATLNHA